MPVSYFSKDTHTWAISWRSDFGEVVKSWYRTDRRRDGHGVIVYLRFVADKKNLSFTHVPSGRQMLLDEYSIKEEFYQVNEWATIYRNLFLTSIYVLDSKTRLMRESCAVHFLASALEFSISPAEGYGQLTVPFSPKFWQSLGVPGSLKRAPKPKNFNWYDFWLTWSMLCDSIWLQEAL